MSYMLEKYDFRNYLLDKLPDTRQEELIFWKNTIPMPVDLIYGIFEKRGILLGKYLEHIGAACLLAYALEKEGEDWVSQLANQPTKENRPQVPRLKQLFSRHFSGSRVLTMLQRLAEALLLNDFTTNEDALAEALCHDGRKYKRLYLPASLKPVIDEYYPKIRRYIAVSNADMFSNVVADELKIYRMGFADAFSGIFNKLIDFILDHATPGQKSYSSASAFRVISNNPAPEKTYSNGIYGKVSDGSIWEPVYRDSRTSFVLNPKHPFCDWLKSKGPAAEEVIAEFIRVMAVLENETINDRERLVLETQRSQVSRALRLRAEEIRMARMSEAPVSPRNT